MPAPRRPKKIFVQFAIALVIAVVLGVGAIIIGFSIITSVSQQAQNSQTAAAKKMEEAKAELARLQEQQKRLQQGPKSYKMVQAIVDIQPGQVVSADMITLIESDERPIMGTLNMLSQAVGKMAKAPIIRGESVEMSKLLDSGSFIDVKTGMRAITLQISSMGMLNGVLLPGSHVDVLITVSKDDRTLTRTLLQNIQVVSVGNGANPQQANGNGRRSGEQGSGSEQSSGSGNSNGNGTVTLIVNPRQAELLTLANSIGNFHLTLRNFSDKQVATISGADLTALMSGSFPAATKKPAHKAPQAIPDDGFHNVNYSPGGLNLPNPAMAGGSNAGKFSMQIYRGTGSETVDFQQ